MRMKRVKLSELIDRLEMESEQHDNSGN